MVDEEAAMVEVAPMKTVGYRFWGLLNRNIPPATKCALLYTEVYILLKIDYYHNSHLFA